MGPLRPFFPKMTSQMSWLRQASARVREWSSRQEEKKRGGVGGGRQEKKGEGWVGEGQKISEGWVDDDVIEKTKK